MSESVAAEADRLVSTDRQGDYGHPYDDYTRVSEMARILELDVYTPEGAALFMVLVKISRESNRHKRDNLVDIAGYAKVLELIHEVIEGDYGGTDPLEGSERPQETLDAADVVWTPVRGSNISAGLTEAPVPTADEDQARWEHERKAFGSPDPEEVWEDEGGS